MISAVLASRDQLKATLAECKYLPAAKLMQNRHESIIRSTASSGVPMKVRPQ